jgi:hypothetical protein
VKRFDELSVAMLLIVDESVFTISGTVLTGWNRRSRRERPFIVIHLPTQFLHWQASGWTWSLHGDSRGQIALALAWPFCGGYHQQRKIFKGSDRIEFCAVCGLYSASIDTFVGLITKINYFVFFSRYSSITQKNFVIRVG